MSAEMFSVSQRLSIFNGGETDCLCTRVRTCTRFASLYILMSERDDCETGEVVGGADRQPSVVFDARPHTAVTHWPSAHGCRTNLLHNKQQT